MKNGVPVRARIVGDVLGQLHRVDVEDGGLLRGLRPVAADREDVVHLERLQRDERLVDRLAILADAREVHVRHEPAGAHRRARRESNPDRADRRRSS